MKRNKNLPLNFKEKNISKISFISSVAVLLVLFFIFFQLDNALIRKPAREAARTMAQQKEEEKKAAETPQISTATVAAVGDNLFHESLIESGRSQEEGAAWNYDHVYENVSNAIQNVDVAIVNQETPLTSSHDSVSSYPSFATPSEVGDALVKAGFDVVSSATNHVDDFGGDMIQETLDFWSANYPEIPVLGIHGSKEDADSVKTLEVNGIKIAFLNYTYGTNNSGAGEGREYMIDIFDKDKISASIEKAKKVSDCIIFLAHWGTENDVLPSEYQKQWAAFLMQQGVDVIIGTHPHVLQPYGRMSDGQGNETVVFYSLGNFVSGQQAFDTLLEGMAKFTIEKTVKNGETSVRILTPEIEPMVMHYNYDSATCSPYMLADYSDDIAASHSGRQYFPEVFSMENLRARFDEIMSANVTPSTGTDLLSASGSTAGTTASASLEDGSEEEAGDYDDEDYE